MKSQLLSVALLLSVACPAATVISDDDNYSGSLVFEFSRESERAVARAESALRGGDLASGLSQLQAALDAPTDTLIRRNGTYRSCWETANELLAGLSEQDRRAYVRLSEQSARRMLVEARRRNDGNLLSRLTDQYRHTPAGREAAVQLAAAAIDHGDMSAAAGWMEFLDRTSTAAPVSASIAAMRERTKSARERGSGTTSASAHQLGSAGSATSWKVDFGLSNRARRAISESLGELNDQSLNPVSTSRPLVVGDRIVARNLFGLLCVNAHTGQTLWNLDDSWAVEESARNPGDLDDPRRRAVVSSRLMRRIVRDSLQDEMSTDGELLFLVGGSDDEARIDLTFGVLTAVDLSSGDVVWRRGGAEILEVSESGRLGSRRFQSSLAYYLGPPLVDDDRLLVLKQRGNVVAVVALDRLNGNTLWTVPVGTSARDLAADPERQSLACRLSMQGSDVFCPTGAGGVACVDVLHRRVRWAYRTPRQNLPAVRLQESSETDVDEMPVADAWTTSEVWRQGDRVVWVSPEADAILVLNSRTGALTWSTPRGDGVSAHALGEDAIVIVSTSSVSARSVADGTQLWTTATPRVVGRGTVLGGRLLLPADSGELLILDAEDGTRLEPNAASPPRRRQIQVQTHPPRGLQPVAVRNLTGDRSMIVSQSPTSLELIPLDGGADDSPSGARRNEWPILADVLSVRRSLDPVVNLLSEADVRATLADHALTALLETAGVLRPVPERIADLVADLYDRNPADFVTVDQTLRALERMQPSRFSISTDQGSTNCRLDQWLLAWRRDRRADQTDRLDASRAGDHRTADEDPKRRPLSEADWPRGAPTVVQQESHGETDYVVRVPMTVSPQSPWNAVTVEVDRQVRSVLFHESFRSESVRVALPREVGTERMNFNYLHAWAPDDVLLLRVGTELLAFRRDPDGRLPRKPLWPAPGTTWPLLGRRPPATGSLRNVAAEDQVEWNVLSPEREDRFGRRVGDVGPVTADYFCYRQRGHLIAVDTQTGVERWRHSRLPKGTRCVGDADQLILFHDDQPNVAVVRPVDGRVVRRWDLADTGMQRPITWRDMKMARGTRGLFVHDEGTAKTLCVLDLTSGQTMWQQSVTSAARLFAATNRFFGLAVPSTSGSAGSVRFLSWETGMLVSNHQGTTPDELRSVIGFSDARALYVIRSDRITDRSLMQVRQIQDGFRRPAVNGWMSAYNRLSGEFLWECRLDNVAVPLDQPRHIPILVANDVVQLDGGHTPTGRLACLDKRTGETLVSLAVPLHAYYSLQTRRASHEIVVRLKGHEIRFRYHHER